MERSNLPEELWSNIFDLATDDAIIFHHNLQTVFAESSWFKTVFGMWALRTYQESMNLVQRRSYATKKAIISTCKLWRQIGSEFLFRCLFIDDPAKLRALRATLEGGHASSFGWRTRRIHITRYYASPDRGVTMEDMENVLVSTIKHCPNTEIFIVEWPMNSSVFGSIANALCTYTSSKSVRLVHWNVPTEALPKVIWALDSLPNLVSAHIEFGEPTLESLHLGAASDIRLSLPNLQQLSLRGFFQEFMEQATGWDIPALKSLSLDCGISRTDQPDVLEFLLHHGDQLTFLDLYCIPKLDVAGILDICPLLTTFSFNADWRLPVPEIITDEGDLIANSSHIVNRPHRNITHIGLHGLLYAFGVGYAATYASEDPMRASLVRQTNDRNVFALTQRENFPSLKCVRVLSRSLLRDLEMVDGPSKEGGCLERWDRWWEMCARIGVRLEDCTGALLGTLPEDEDEEEEEEEGEAEEGDSDGGLYEDESRESESEKDDGPPEGSLADLRQLLEQCKKMTDTREEPIIPFFSPSGTVPFFVPAHAPR